MGRTRWIGGRKGTKLEWRYGMIEIKMTNSHYDKTYTVDCGLKDFKARFHNHTATVGYVEFTDVDGVFVIVSPDKFASVEIKELEGTK